MRLSLALMPRSDRPNGDGHQNAIAERAQDHDGEHEVVVGGLRRDAHADRGGGTLVMPLSPPVNEAQR